MASGMVLAFGDTRLLPHLLPSMPMRGRTVNEMLC
jgi:hypothetical protein